MYSVNVPVPGRVRELAGRLYPELQPFDRIRREHSLVLKRLPEDEPVETLQRRVHVALGGAPAVEAAVTGIDRFLDPPVGTAPVVYLAVDSPGLEVIHADLTDAFDPIPGLEGPDYVPHVTLARGGTERDADRLAARDVEPIRWTVTELEFYDARRRQPVSRVSLPAKPR